MSYAIGIDVGGTNTDVALIEYPCFRIVNWSKTSTTKDFTTGILNGIKQVLTTQSEITEYQVCAVMIGTTTFLNAVLQASNDLNSVVVIRLCGKATRSLPPFITVPDVLANKIKSSIYYVDGGHEYDYKEAYPLDTKRLEEIGGELIATHQNKLLSIVFTGIFSPLYNDHEDKAAEILRNYFDKHNFSNFHITKSHQIGTIGLLEREGAAILNASLIQLSNNSIKNLKTSIRQLNLLSCENNIFFTHNDGTLLQCDLAVEFPIFTFNSGPTNSIRGASKLTNIKNAIIADIGGTSTDVAVLHNGFPRAASSYVSVAGVRTNFSIPDTLSIALGGGSLVKMHSEDENMSCTIGPVSVGYKLIKEAKCFGGNILTSTDVAIATRKRNIANADPSKVQMSQEQIEKANEVIVKALDNLIDRIKTTPETIPLILVGGGSIIVPDNAKIEGISEIIRPNYHSVANAIGAAIAQVSGEAEDIIDSDNEAIRTEKLRLLRERAAENAVRRGAIRDSIEFIQNEVHISYLPGRVVRVTCKAIGDLNLNTLAENIKQTDQPSKIADIYIPQENIEPFIESTSAHEEQSMNYKESEIKFEINPVNNRKEWILTEDDIEYIALGAGILGAGGGGSPYVGKIELIETIRKGNKIRVISADSLEDDEQMFWVSYYGAPLVMIEKLAGSDKLIENVKIMQKLTQKPIDCLGCIEIGGLNSLGPLYAAGYLNVPVVDGDFMGRAFPELQMTNPFFCGYSYVPCCLLDEKGNSHIVEQFEDPHSKKLEMNLREAAMKLGCECSLSSYPFSGKETKKLLIKRTMSHIWKLGKSLHKAKKLKLDPLKILQESEKARLLFIGKIVDISRFIEGGYNKGTIKLSGFDDFKDKWLTINFQNENLIATLEEGDEKKVIASVPDIISLVDFVDYQPILTEDLKYGLRASVLGIPCSPTLREPNALKHISPRNFGYDLEYTPISDTLTFDSDVFSL